MAHYDQLVKPWEPSGPHWAKRAQDDVTTFTMSDFGRTLDSNGNGSDHAWGGHQIVMGGRVDGNKLYGRMPLMQLNANNNSEQDWSLSRGQYIRPPASIKWPPHWRNGWASPTTPHSTPSSPTSPTSVPLSRFTLG